MRVNNMKLPITTEWLKEHEGCGCCSYGFEDDERAAIINSVNNHYKLVDIVKRLKTAALVDGGLPATLLVIKDAEQALREAGVGEV